MAQQNSLLRSHAGPPGTAGLLVGADDQAAFGIGRVAPDRRIVRRVGIRSADRRGFGERQEVVSIFSTDMVTPEVRVTLKANVVDSLTKQSPVKQGESSVPFK